MRTRLNVDTVSNILEVKTVYKEDFEPTAEHYKLYNKHIKH